jgi:hypothetical protein
VGRIGSLDDQSDVTDTTDVLSKKRIRSATPNNAGLGMLRDAASRFPA